MIEICTERDFFHVLAGVLVGRDLSTGLAAEAVLWWRNARGPRSGLAGKVGGLLNRISEGDFEGEPAEWLAAANTELRALVSQWIDERKPSALTAAVHARMSTHEEKLLVGTPTMEADLRDLERLSHLLRIRSHLFLEGLGLEKLTAKMLRRMDEEDPDEAAAHRLGKLLGLLGTDTPDVPAETTLERLRNVAKLVDPGPRASEVDSVYRERNTLACVVARLVHDVGGTAGVFVDEKGVPGFQCVVAFDLEAAFHGSVGRVDGGQVTFHMDESDETRPWAGLPKYPRAWDGHTAAEKWTRVRAYLESPFLTVQAPPSPAKFTSLTTPATPLEALANALHTWECATCPESVRHLLRAAMKALRGYDFTPDLEAAIRARNLEAEDR